MPIRRFKETFANNPTVEVVELVSYKADGPLHHLFNNG
jgi:hypothetical protein